MLNTQFWQTFISPDNRHKIALALGIGGAVAGGLIGLSLALVGPIITIAMLGALVVAIWALTDLELGLWGVIGIIALLPFATLPFKIVLTPTFLDLAIVGVFAVYLMQWMTGRRIRFYSTPVHGLIIAFMLLATFNYIAGLRYAGLASNVLRHFAELLLSMALALMLTDIIREKKMLKRLVVIVMVAGGIAALLAIFLYALPDELANRSLNALSRIGYPEGGVVRYIEDNPALAERAIGTGVDPNAFGGFLVIIGALIAPQLGTQHPVLPRRWMVWALLGIVLTGIFLTYSRGAMVAFGVAALYIGGVRYRRMVLVVAGLGTLLLFLPFTQDYTQHLIEGFRGEDLATQMRYGEYSDAFKLIARYPLIGVGFGGSPDIDLYLGVSSVYLLIAESMGIVGLVAFLLVMASVFAYAWNTRPQLKQQPGLEPIMLGLTAGLLAILASGVVDHYFFNIEFQHTVAMLWIVVGLTLAVTRLGLSASAEQTPTDMV